MSSHKKPLCPGPKDLRFADATGAGNALKSPVVIPVIPGSLGSLGSPCSPRARALLGTGWKSPKNLGYQSSPQLFTGDTFFGMFWDEKPIGTECSFIFLKNHFVVTKSVA
jgi:hypothetical protein